MGYGFTTVAEGGQDLVVHCSSVDRGGYEVLKEGQRLIFNVGARAKGPRAEAARPG